MRLKVKHKTSIGECYQENGAIGQLENAASLVELKLERRQERVLLHLFVMEHQPDMSRVIWNLANHQVIQPHILQTLGEDGSSCFSILNFCLQDIFLMSRYFSCAINRTRLFHIQTLP